MTQESEASKDPAPEVSGETEAAAPPAGEATAAPVGEAAAQEAADPCAPFDDVLQQFAQERRVGVGTLLGEQTTDRAGRFVGWTNAVGWRCLLQLVHEAQENVTVLVAQGPPLPGGRPRLMPLAIFPPAIEQETIRAWLEIGYLIGET